MDATLPTDLIRAITKDIQTTTDPDRLHNEAVAYHGQLKKHKSNPERIYLLLDPLSPGSLWVEFKVSDILYAENFSTLTGPQGEAVPVTRVWVKKGAVGLQLTPFVVSDLSNVQQDHLA